MKILNNPKEIINTRLFKILFLVVNISILLLIFSQRKFIIFRDYSVIWDGAYRISNGLTPYTDFGIPVGPISFYLPALFFKLFGASWFNLQLSQFVINFSLIFTAWKILNLISSNKYYLYFGMTLFMMNYIILLSHPWYNTSAALLLLLSILLILYSNIYFNFLSGFICAVCIFTKQDYALMSIFSSSILILFLNKNKDLFIPKNIYEIIDKLFSIRFLLFLIGLLSGVILFFNIFDSSQMGYWFNYGQFPHYPRTPSLTRTILNTQFYLSIICLWVSFLKKDLSLFVSFLILLSSGVCSQTSGLIFTSGFFIFLTPLIFFQIYKLNYNLLKSLPVLLLLFISIFNNLNRSLNIFKGVIKNKFEPSSMSYSDLKISPSDLSKCASEFRNIYGPSSICRQIDLIRKELKGRDSDRKIVFLNMSELTPLQSILDVEIASKLPLWFDEDVTLFKREKEIIKENIQEGKYDLIALQATHDPWNEFYNQTLEEILNNKNYRELGDMQYVSPKGSLSYFYVKDKCNTSLSENYYFSEDCEKSLKPIRFFIRKNL